MTSFAFEKDCGVAVWKMGQRQGAVQVGQMRWQGFELSQCRRAVGKMLL